MKQFLFAPSILVRPKEKSPLTLYSAVLEKDISFVLVQDSDEGEKSFYFVNKVVKGVEIRYQKNKQLSLVVVITAKKLRQYFQGRPIIVKSNYPMKQILKNLDLAGRMVVWVVELSKHDITFTPRRISDHKNWQIF